MAARQDQTLQIFLIIFIFAFLVSAVVAYLGWRGYSEAEQRAAALQTEVSNKNQQTQNLQTDLEDMREMMGFGRNDNTADIKQAFENDMKAMGGGVADEESRSYRTVLEAVFADARQTAQREAKLKEQLKERDTRLAAVEAEAKAQIEEYNEARKTAEAQLAAVTNQFKEDRDQLEKTKAELQKTLEQQRANYEKTIADQQSEIKGLTDKITKLERAVANLIEQRKDEPESFEVADGRISWVNPNGTVWINLGSADDLRRQVTFSVYDSDQTDAARAEKKGSIEVTRILGEHMAEARVTDERPTNPIMTGDQIYSQVWHPGKKVRFALTGIVDIDGDGRSDMQLARQLIELNGGIVDAFVNDQGEIEGQITAHTRYLVLGDFPELPTQGAHQTSWHSMTKEASSLGVQTITIQEFLNQMGYKPQDRTVQLGSGASALDFPARRENGAASRFRPRTPNRTPASTPR